MPSPHLRRIRLPLLALMLSCSSEWNVARSSPTQPPAANRGSEVRTPHSRQPLTENPSADELIELALESARSTGEYDQSRNLNPIAEILAMAGNMSKARSVYIESYQAEKKIDDWDFR